MWEGRQSLGLTDPLGRRQGLNTLSSLDREFTPESLARAVLLHGDFHPGNVLSAQREPWLAIDCKPVVGDPAYDLAQWLGNRYEAVAQSPDPVATLRRQIRRFASLSIV